LKVVIAMNANVLLGFFYGAADEGVGVPRREESSAGGCVEVFA
jgi:hypothetical protein